MAVIGTHHAACGAIVGAAVAQYVHCPADQFPLVVAVVVVGALCPDIDTPVSLISQALGPFGRPITKAVIAWTVRAGGPKNGHRGITHQIPVQVVFCGLISPVTIAPHVPWWLPYALLLGMLVHDAGDIPTRSGLCVTWPIPIRGDRWREVPWPRWMRFRVGSKARKFDDKVGRLVWAAPFEAWILGPVLMVGCWLSIPGAPDVTWLVGAQIRDVIAYATA